MRTLEKQHSRFLRFNRITDCAELSAKIDELMAMCGVSNQEFPTIVLDLLARYHQHHKLDLAYSRSTKDYSGAKMLGQNVSAIYSHVIDSVDALASLGFIEKIPGDWRRKKMSSMRAKGKLADFFHGLWDRQTTLDYSEIVIKRGDEALAVKPFDAMLAGISVEVIRAINEQFRAHEININLDNEDRDELLRRFIDENKQIPDMSRTKLYRVFNDELCCGGRFYGHFVQNLPKYMRNRVTIDGEPVIEYDFTALHPNLLYIEATGDIFNGDPYVISGFDRNLIKVMLNTMINAATIEKAINSVMYEARKPTKEGKKPHPAKGVSKESLWLAVDSIVDRHGPIKGSIGSGAGLRLQFLDSQIAEKVMQIFAFNGNACIPIHDSFIVKASLATDLAAAMICASSLITGNVIKFKDADDNDVYEEFCRKHVETNIPR